MRFHGTLISNRILAIALSIVMIFSMIPASQIVAAEVDYGTVEALTEGATLSGDKANLVLSYGSVELEWVDVDASQGRTKAGWYIGMRVHAPENMRAESDFVNGENKVTVQTKGMGGWSASLNFWDNQNSDKTTEETDRYIDLWYYLDESRLISGKVNGTLAFGFRADWNMDGDFEQVITMQIDPLGVTLKKGDNVVFPLVGSGSVSILNSDGSYNAAGKIEGNGTDYVKVSPAATVYAWCEATADRTTAGWWAGIRIDVPAGMTEEQLQNVQYKLNNNVGSFWNDHETDANGTHYITLWKSLNKLEAGEELSVSKMELDWNNDGVFEQLIEYTVIPANVTLMKGEEQMYPKYTVSVNVNDKDGGTTTLDSTTVKKNELVEFNVTANAGYRIAKVDGFGNAGEVEISEDKLSAKVAIRPTADMTINVIFEHVYTVEITHDNDGTIKVQNNTVPANEGSIEIAESDIKGKITVTAIPRKGFTITAFTVTDLGEQVLPNLPAEENEEYIAELTPGNYQITIAFADKTPPKIEVEEPDEKWAPKKTIEFTVEDSADGECTVYISNEAKLNIETAEKLSAPLNSDPYTYVVAEDVSEAGKTFYIHAVDANGVQNTEAITVKCIDTQAPEITNIKEVASRKTKNITYWFDVSDLGGSGIDKVVYTTDTNGVDNLKTATKDKGKYRFTVSDGQQYYIFAYDKAGNMVKETPVDTAPSFSEIATPKVWVKGSFVITFEVTTESGSVTTYWSETPFESVEAVKTNGTVLTAAPDGTYSFTVTNNGTYYVYAIDAADCMASVPVEIARIDNEDPVVSATKAPNVEWTNECVTISGQASDKQDDVTDAQPKVVEVRYSTAATFSLENSTLVENFNAETGAYSFVIDTEDESILNNTYYVWAIDEVGHVSKSVSVAVKIDKVKPVGTVSVEGYNPPWTKLFENLSFGIFRNNDVTVGLSYSDVDDTNSGINNVQYFVADIAENSNEGLSKEALVAAYDAGKFEAYPSEGVVINSDRRSAVYFRIEDNAGNATYLNSNGIIRDTTPPIGTITVQKQDSETEEFKDWNSWSDFPQGNVDNRYFACYSNTALKVIITANDEAGITSGIAFVKYYKSNKILTYAEIQDANVQWEAYTDNLEFTGNERFVIYARIEDNAGNVTYLSTNGIVLDNKQPSGAKIEETEIIITPEKDNLVEDSGIYKGDVTVSVTVYDPKFIGSEGKDNGDFSGLKEITYKVFTKDTNAVAEGILYKQTLGEDEKIGDLLINPNADHTTLDSETGLVSLWAGQILIPAEQFNSNNVVVEITAIDNAGNSRTTVTTAGDIKIDVTAPTIRIEYNNNDVDSDNYYNNDRTATIIVTERNFNPKDFIVNITASSDGKVPALSDWTTTAGTGNMDDTTYTATITFGTDGDYTFNVEVEDMVGWTCGNVANTTYDGALTYAEGTKNETAFTIDKTAPVISVAYNNNSAANDKYFKDYRTATITIVEHNFPVEDIARVVFSQTAGRGGVVPTVSWSHNGDTHTATFVYSKDGDYTFDVAMTDLAGNESAAANYGDSVAGKDFVIDTTFEDMISQEGVENGVAYGHDAEVIPNIKISDINLQEYTVTLTGIQKDKTIDLTSEVNALLNKSAETVTGILDIFETTQDLDGIYTLKMTSKDKAGNEDSMKIVFTVNRFGSVYVFEDYLLNLVKDGGAFVQKIDNDLVITEFNADKLIAGSLKIEITVDGKPLENVQYTVTPEINDTVSVGSSGWYQYKYTISKDNFAADGVYKISVSSEDATGNTPENSNYEDKGMTFRVDSTQSEITSIVGLEDAIINAQNVTVKYTVFDTIGLKFIKVYVNGQLVDEISDFSADMNNYNGQFMINEQTSAQSVRIVVEDMSGNITDTSAEDFSSAYAFNDSVTVSTNVFVRWYANKGLFWGSIAGVIVVAGALIVFLASKKKKKAEATAK